MDLATSTMAFIGHTALCVWLFNRLHATAWPCRWIRVLERLILAFAAAVLAIYLGRWLATGVCVYAGGLPALSAIPWLVYPTLCGVAAAMAVPLWAIPKLLARTPAALLSNHTARLDLVSRVGVPLAGTKTTAFMAALPGNEIFSLAIQTKRLHVPGLPPALTSLRIAHLSDLHMTGRFTRPFYEEIVRQTNELAPDMIALTGDICEKEACLDWVVPVLSQLRAPQGKFFVLGNHETRLGDVKPLRDRLSEAGFIDVASRWRITEVNGTPLLIAGTELPWFGAAPDLSSAPQEPLRLLLSHSPDELPWAKRHGFDIMLAGHNHGGQIRLPFLGPLITPSRFGFRYAGGIYHEPPTLLHVSRGIAGLHPLRFNCPPELPLLVLESQA